jgi:geranylgeranyl transferase type-2 subunit beta
MMNYRTVTFLDALDGVLLTGIARIRDAFLLRQARFADCRRTADGGFAGRRGAADLYYTDFGVRLITLLTPDCNTFDSIARWVTGHQASPTTIIESFSLLNIERMLRRCGVEMPAAGDSVVSTLERQQLADGGFARPGGSDVSAYNTFLAALCCEMIGISFPHSEGSISALRGLKRADGGYLETSGQSISQTNATTAAVACLTMLGGLAEADGESAAGFLAQMQSPDGGFLAQPTAPEGDLLSTFTSIVALFGLNALDRIDLPAVARFAGLLADRSGGFRASLSDDEPDIEYTYYGVGTLALLRAYLLARE